MFEGKNDGGIKCFLGDLRDENSVLEWLIDDDNRELDEQIESVNGNMLERLLETSPFIAVFFHDDDCAECEAILESLEQVQSNFSNFAKKKPA